jgi:hypothetical protein
MMPSKSCPIIGQNSKGFFQKGNNKRPVVVVSVDPVVGIFHLQDLETNEYYVAHPSLLLMPPQIPSQFRQEAFNRVAHIWARAINNLAVPVVIDPAPLSIVSYARLLRNARESKNTYGWTHPFINEDFWHDHNHKISVTEQTDCIVVGLKTIKFPPKSESVGVIKATDEVLFHWKFLTELENFCALMDKDAFSPEPNFVVQNLTPDIITTLEGRYDIGFVQQEHDKTKWSVI